MSIDSQVKRDARGYTRFKTFILLLLFLAFLALLLFRALGMLPDTISTIGDLNPFADQQATESSAVVSDSDSDNVDPEPSADALEPTATDAPTPEPEPTDEPEPTAEPEAEASASDADAGAEAEEAADIAELSWDSAVISPDVTRLTLSGQAEPDTTINVIVDDETAGTVTTAADGSWELDTPLPAPGLYPVFIQMLDADNAVLAETQSRGLQVPEAAAPTAEPEPTVAPTAEPAPTEAPEAEEVEEEAAADADAEEVEEEAAAATSATISSETDFSTFTGGIVSFNGSAEPNQEIEIVIANGDSEEVEAVTANDAGDWSFTRVITASGAYVIGESGAESPLSFTIPDGVVYGTDGNCLSGIPPFGTISGSTYIVAPCEYFSLIAERLEVSFVDLLNANQNIPDIERLEPGDILNIP